MNHNYLDQNKSKIYAAYKKSVFLKSDIKNEIPTLDEALLFEKIRLMMPDLTFGERTDDELVIVDNLSLYHEFHNQSDSSITSRLILLRSLDNIFYLVVS